MSSLNVMELEYTYYPVILRIWNPALIPCLMVSLAIRKPVNAGTHTGYHVNIHDLYKHLIGDRMKAFDLNEQVLLKRRITIMNVDDVKALDIAHDCG